MPTWSTTTKTFKSFVMVQYKSMNQGANRAEFRWRPGDKLADEIVRMDSLLQALSLEPHDTSAASFRLHTNPFFLKLCPRLIFNPDDRGLTKGMYLPLDFFKALGSDPSTKGPRNGRVITYDNVPRRLNNQQFIALVSQAWVGTTVPQSKVLGRVIESVIQSGKTLTLAVKEVSQTAATFNDSQEEQDVESLDLQDQREEP